MATLDKNFRIKNGLVVEGSTATVNGNQILTENASDQYILTLIGGETLVKDVDSHLSVDGSGKLSINRGIVDEWYDAAGAADAAYDNAVATAAQDATTKANAAEQNAISTASTDATNKANAAQSAAATDASNKADAAELAAKNYADGLASNYDEAGAAQNALNSANNYTNGEISSAITTAQNYADGLASNYDAVGSANTAENNAKAYADGLASNAVTTANAYTDTAVANVVGAAPEVLDTLEELATALENNPDIIANLENVAAGKQDTLATGNGIVIDNNLIYIPTSIGSGVSITPNTVEIDRAVVDTWYDSNGAAASAQSNAETFATNAANTAQSNAEDYADGLAGNYDAAGSAATAQSNAETTAQNALNSVLAGDTTFTEVGITWATTQVASYAYAPSGNQVVAYAWNHNKGASAKFLVRTRNGSHSQVSEILLTRDNSNNIAITEYGIVTTNGILADITAEMNGNNIELKVTPTHNDGTEIIVSGTLMTYGD